MGAEGSQAAISYIEEVAWGVTPAGQMTGMNFVSEDMAFALEKQASNNVRPDRQTTALVNVGAEVSGGPETEFQAENIDGLLPGFLWAQDWTAPPQTSDSVSFATEVGAGVGGVMTFAKDVSAFRVGHFFTISGSGSNDGTFLAKAVTTNTIQVYEPLITEGAAAVTIGGQTIINGVFKHSYSIERAQYDISQFFLYAGMTGNTLEMTVESGSPVMADLKFVGKNEQLQQTTWGTGSPTALPVTPIMSSVSSVGRVLLGGSVLSSCLLQKVSFTLDNQVDGKTGVGVLGNCDTKAKSLKLSGTITLYFNDKTYYEKYLNSDAFGLLIDLVDADGSVRSIFIPQSEFDTMTANVTGKDDDVLLEGTFISYIGPGGYTIQIGKA